MSEPTFVLDLRESLLPSRYSGSGEYFPELEAPDLELDRERGLSFPLKSGGIAFASRGELDDSAGSVSIEFSVDLAAAGGGTLFQAWVDYLKVSVNSEGVTVTSYSDSLQALTGRLAPSVVHSLTVAWDHRSGLALRLEADGAVICERGLRRQWRPYRTKWCPFSVGGHLQGRRLARWENCFRGHIQSVKLWKHPILPLPHDVKVDEATGAGIFAGVPGIRVLSRDDPPIHESGYAHQTIPERIDDLEMTREVGQLTEVVKRCRTEFEEFVALTEFVTNLYPHSWYWPSPKDSAHLIIWKPGHEIIQGLRDGEMGGMCGSYAHVMEEVFWAMGHEGRRVQVDGHSTFEAWSNQFNKWVELEADSACAGHAEFLDGTPLNAWDSIRVHQDATRDPAAYRQTRNVPHRSQGTGASASRSDRLYLAPKTHVVIPIGDYEGGFKRGGAYGWHVPGHNFGDDSFMYEPNGWVDDPQALYWSCNRVRVGLKWAEAGECLSVTVEAVQAAYLQAIEVSIDDGTPADARTSFEWRLQPGVNTLCARTRNSFGVTGYPYRIEIWRG